MAYMKYIIVRKHGLSLEVPILFHEAINHKDINVSDVGDIVSAGFCEFEHEVYEGGGACFVRAYGRSDSLDINSRENDENIIRMMLDID